MSAPSRVVTLFDSDNTLLDHDKVVADLLADRIYPGSLEVIEHFGNLGPTVILSDGDVVFSRARSSAQDYGTQTVVE